MQPLSLENVVKCFHQGQREVRALDGFTLDVEAGRFLAVMGQSGSGKSTLLHLAAGLALPDSGIVRVAGTDITQMSDRELTLFRRRNIGLVFQSFNLIPTLTAEENVALPLMLDARSLRASGNGRLAPRASASAIMERLNLAHRMGHRPDAMSGGEQQRVAIARALVTDPALILADEPTGNLDSENGRAVCELLRRLGEEGRTIVMVTHEPSVAAHAQEVVVLRDGRLIDRFEVSGSHDPGQVAHRYQASVASPVQREG